MKKLIQFGQIPSDVIPKIHTLEKKLISKCKKYL